MIKQLDARRIANVALESVETWYGLPCGFQPGAIAPGDYHAVTPRDQLLRQLEAYSTASSRNQNGPSNQFHPSSPVELSIDVV
ncbi:hypothetical protein PUN4_410101 [Paraburkholderia unamae]|nr:hypothetical protein PUN4_410101 [Paraburkholderia unamae]